MNPFTFNRRAGSKKSGGKFAYFRRGRMEMGRRHNPMQGTARRRLLRQSLEQDDSGALRGRRGEGEKSWAGLAKRRTGNHATHRR